MLADVQRFDDNPLPYGANCSDKHSKKRLKTGGFSPKTGNNSAKQDDFLPYIVGFHLKHEKSANKLFALFCFTAAVGVKM